MSAQNIKDNGNLVKKYHFLSVFPKLLIKLYYLVYSCHLTTQLFSCCINLNGENQLWDGAFKKNYILDYKYWAIHKTDIVKCIIHAERIHMKTEC